MHFAASIPGQNHSASWLTWSHFKHPEQCIKGSCTSLQWAKLSSPPSPAPTPPAQSLNRSVETCASSSLAMLLLGFPPVGGQPRCLILSLDQACGRAALASPFYQPCKPHHGSVLLLSASLPERNPSTVWTGAARGSWAPTAAPSSSRSRKRWPSMQLPFCFPHCSAPGGANALLWFSVEGPLAPLLLNSNSPFKTEFLCHLRLQVFPDP